MRVITLGEMLLRLSPHNYNRLVQADSFDIVYGGAEANVAMSLAGFGLESYYVTKLPEHYIGQSAVNHLRKYGVNTDFIVRGGERLGIYFLENGASIRPSRVIYDRANSAISEANSTEFDFNKIMEGARWFHFTGITPAISDNAVKLTLEALQMAKKHNVTVSLDMNYRSKLWTVKKAKEVMTKLMPYVDVFIGSERDAIEILGCQSNDKESVFKELINKYELQYVVSTVRESYSASDNGWSALLFDGDKFYYSKKYQLRIVDRVGGGDSFASGLIYGLIKYNDLQQALEFAVGASALKHTIPGDANLVTAYEVEELIQGDNSGRVQR